MAARDFSGFFEERIRAIVQPMVDDLVNKVAASFLGTTSVPPRRGPGRPRKAVTAAAAGQQACNVAGCVRPMRSKGYCGAHYQSARKYGWPMPAPVGFNAPARGRGRPPRNAATATDRAAPAQKVRKSRRRRAGRKSAA